MSHCLPPPTARGNGLNLSASPPSQLFTENCSREVIWKLALGSQRPIFLPVTWGAFVRGQGAAVPVALQQPCLSRSLSRPLHSVGQGPSLRAWKVPLDLALLLPAP